MHGGLITLRTAVIESVKLKENLLHDFVNYAPNSDSSLKCRSGATESLHKLC